jgi:methionine sulfoxide reductase heme-binding subunit
MKMLQHPDRTMIRHALILVLAGLLVYLFGMVHSNWSPMHRWNRATGDASIVLLAMTMAIGPGARPWPRLGRLVPFRRELGIYGVALATVHTVIILDGWVVWELPRLFGLEWVPELGRYLMVQHGFGLANLIGILALVYGLVLIMTSNNISVRILGGSSWKFVQLSAYVYWSLVIVHTSYFLFFHFLSFHRPLPPPNPLRWPFIVMVLLVVALQWAAFVRVWRDKRRRRPATGRLRHRAETA